MGTIFTSSKNALPKSKRPVTNPKTLVFLAVAVLLTIPLNYAFGSITLILFTLYALFTAKKQDFSFSIALFMPVALFLLMAASLLWTIDFKSTLKALSKEIPLLIIPVVFCIIRLWPKQQRDTLKFYSWGMFIYALFYIARAFIKYFETGDSNVFFYHDLVTKDVNAIYVSVFMSVALFYFVAKKRKRKFDYLALLFLFVFIFLLSSKNILLTDILLTILYFLFWSPASKKTKWTFTTVFAVAIVIAGYFGKIKERVEVELKPNTEQAVKDMGTRAVTIAQAWNNETFSQNDYFNGTSFRVYQIRIFTEMMSEDPVLLTGYGLNASLNRIKEKGDEHNVYKGDETHRGYNTLNFHNQYIEIFADLGLIGFLVLMVMLGINLKNGLSNKDFVHIAFAFLMIALFLTESFLWRQRGVIFFTVLYCLFNKELYSSVIEKERS
ncbi:O-antigen ligase family protein [Flavobacterium rakeshii]|uniref:O-antigen ligase family protein n=1 Tax=Flavobacterium rakeshii TaxID=1038845 RepID=UPI002E7AD6C4|nr:O-antigen ligase family protein [Flavobacterium rakeshii]MEE1897302.1 O-antigen ligase family protein [Flavobacterium rakeshii]